MKARITIEGIVPLLMHRYPIEQARELKRKGEIPSHDEECQRALYRNERGCYVPSSWISAMLIQAGSNFRKGKGTYKELMKTVVVEPEHIPLLKKNGEVYETYDDKLIVPVVIQRQRVVKARPRFNEWKLSFAVEFDEKLIESKVMEEIMSLGGKMIGIGDWRPKYGRFKVTEFK